MIIKCPVCGKYIGKVPDTANDATNTKLRYCDYCWENVLKKGDNNK